MPQRRIIVGLIHIDTRRTKVEIDLIYRAFIQAKGKVSDNSHKQPQSKIEHASHVHHFVVLQKVSKPLMSCSFGSCKELVTWYN
jgi:hypothetical protein